QVVDGNVNALVVEGDIFNASGEAALLPPLRLDLLTENQEVAASQTFDLEIGRLKAGASKEFEIRFDDPPAAAQSFRLTFPSADDDLD
ncbi:MAG: hypothetical protein AAFY56_18205, partial [Pseudomonadota bacterium]